jgi:hypothetical protein
MSTLGDFKDYDEALARLAEAQRYKLRINAKKGWLGDVPPDRLLALLKGEIPELEDAFKRGSQIEIILEAADIANFALGFVISAIQKLNGGIRHDMGNAAPVSDRVSRPVATEQVGHTAPHSNSVRGGT